MIEQFYNLVRHTTHIPSSSLDMVLYAIKSMVSAVGSFIILVGVLLSLYRFIVLRLWPSRASRDGIEGINFIRRDLGLTIVLGLEFIIAADVIETTTTPDYYSLGILGLIVLIRTFLSYSLSREISQLTPPQKERLNH